MDFEIMLGFAATLGVVALIAALVFQSRRIIHRIADKGLHTARDIVKERGHGR